MPRLDTVLSRCAMRARVTHVKAPHRKGFNLVEAAIVLGVVGLVIGGIWVAAGYFQYRSVINKIVNDTATLVTNIDQAELHKTISGTDVNITTYLHASKKIPADWNLVGGMLVNTSQYGLSANISGNGTLSLYLYAREQSLSVCKQYHEITRQLVKIFSNRMDSSSVFINGVGGTTAVNANTISPNCSDIDSYPVNTQFLIVR